MEQLTVPQMVPNSVMPSATPMGCLPQPSDPQMVPNSERCLASTMVPKSVLWLVQ